jgi:hypothetical protein
LVLVQSFQVAGLVCRVYFRTVGTEFVGVIHILLSIKIKSRKAGWYLGLKI